MLGLSKISSLFRNNSLPSEQRPLILQNFNSCCWANACTQLIMNSMDNDRELISEIDSGNLKEKIQQYDKAQKKGKSRLSIFFSLNIQKKFLNMMNGGAAQKSQQDAGEFMEALHKKMEKKKYKENSFNTKDNFAESVPYDKNPENRVLNYRYGLLLGNTYKEGATLPLDDTDEKKSEEQGDINSYVENFLTPPNGGQEVETNDYFSSSKDVVYSREDKPPAKVVITKREYFEPPHMIAAHLTRTGFDPTISEVRKYTGTLTLPESLTYEKESSVYKQLYSNSINKGSNPPSELKYNFRGAIIHSGKKGRFGHYYSYVVKNEKLYYCNDCDLSLKRWKSRIRLKSPSALFSLGVVEEVKKGTKAYQTFERDRDTQAVFAYYSKEENKQEA